MTYDYIHPTFLNAYPGTSPRFKKNRTHILLIDDILRLFEDSDPIWPRRISTRTTNSYTIPVYSKEEALSKFRESNYEDCKICAYPYYVEWKGINRQAPNLLFIDIDENQFKSKIELDLCLKQTFYKIQYTIGGNPTVIWSGHGYHIYQPVNAFVFEQESKFADFEQPSRRLIQFAEQYLSNKKSDPCHSHTMSFKNCMLRIPGSYNSKTEPIQEVKIIRQWDGNRPTIKPLLFDFYLYLQDLRLKKIRQYHSNGEKECRYWSSIKK